MNKHEPSNWVQRIFVQGDKSELDHNHRKDILLIAHSVRPKHLKNVRIEEVFKALQDQHTTLKEGEE